MMFAAAVGHRSGRATPSLRGAPQRQSMEIVRRETIYRNRNAVQTNPATSEAEVRSVPSGNQVAGDSSGVLPGFWMQHRARRIVVDSEWIKATFGICHRYQNVRANRRLVWTGLRAARQG